MGSAALSVFHRCESSKYFVSKLAVCETQRSSSMSSCEEKELDLPRVLHTCVCFFLLCQFCFEHLSEHSQVRQRYKNRKTLLTDYILKVTKCFSHNDPSPLQTGFFSEHSGGEQSTMTFAGGQGQSTLDKSHYV